MANTVWISLSRRLIDLGLPFFGKAEQNAKDLLPFVEAVRTTTATHPTAAKLFRPDCERRLVSPRPLLFGRWLCVKCQALHERPNAPSADADATGHARLAPDWG